MSSSEWPPYEVVSSKHQLGLLRQHVLEIRDMESKVKRENDTDTLSWLGRLLVIRSCGHLEKVMLTCAKKYIESKSGGYVQTFALNSISRSLNPTENNMVKFLGLFDNEWADGLKSWLDLEDEKLRRDLAWAVSTRNAIAHGESQGASPSRAISVCESVDMISDWWVDTLNPGKS